MPVTRARTSTSREPAVWPTYSKVAGTDCGCTVTTATSGARMPACGCELAGSQPERSAATAATDSAAAAAKRESLIFMILLPFSWGGCEPALGIDRRAPRVVLAILARERIDQALDAVVADFFAESVAVGGREARTADLDVVHLPSRRRLLHLVIDGNRLSPRLPDFGPDGDLRVSGLGAQGSELEHLVAVAHERAGIRAHEKRPEFPNELLALLGAGAPPAGAHRDPGRMREIEVGQDLRLDEGRDLFRLDVFVLADRGEHLKGNGLDECVRRQFLRGRSRRGKGEHESRSFECVAHVQILLIRAIGQVSAVAAESAPGLLTTLCQDRKSTRLNSSHLVISYAVFCL